MILLYFDRVLFERHEAQLRTEISLPILHDSNEIDVARARQSFSIGKCDYALAGLLKLTIGGLVVEFRRVICDT